MFNGTFQFWFLTRFMPDWHTELFQLHSDFQFLCCDSSVLIWFDFPPVECAYFAICLLCHILIDKRITINQDVFCSKHIWNPPPGTPKRREVLATNHIINDYAEWCILFFVKLVHFFSVFNFRLTWGWNRLHKMFRIYIRQRLSLLVEDEVRGAGNKGMTCHFLSPW